MSTESRAVPPAEAPSTPRELVEWSLQPGDAAAHLYEPEFYIVARTHAVAPLEAVPIDELRADDAIEGVDEALEAVASEEIAAEVIPEKWVVPLMEEFLEAEKRGEWDGLRDYLGGDR